MREYFDDSLKVKKNKKNVIPSFNAGYHIKKKDRKHLVGHVLARKKYKRRKYKYTYDVSISFN